MIAVTTDAPSAPPGDQLKKSVARSLGKAFKTGPLTLQKETKARNRRIRAGFSFLESGFRAERVA